MAGAKRSSKSVAAEPAAVAVADSASGEESSARIVNAVPSSFVKQIKESLPESIKLRQKDLKVVCEVFIKTLVDQVKTGNTVSFTNNMTFKRVKRDDRMHKNPKTGEEVFKPAHYVMTMEVKPMLKKKFEGVTVTDEPKKGGASESEQEGAEEVAEP